MKKIFLVVSIIVMFGCSLGPSFDRIAVGFSKEQVEKALGKPDTIAVQGKTEDWKYEDDSWYFVRFIDAKVESFGSSGDFDSTKDKTEKIIIDKIDRITSDKTVNTSFDLATEISKLDKLKKDGLISAEDYELLKKKAIEKAKE